MVRLLLYSLVRFYRTLTLIIFNVCPRFFQKSACHSYGNSTLYWHIKCPKLSSWKAEKSRTKTQNFTAWFVLPRDQQYLGFCPRFCGTLTSKEIRDISQKKKNNLGQHSRFYSMKTTEKSWNFVQDLRYLDFTSLLMHFQNCPRFYRMILHFS